MGYVFIRYVKQDKAIAEQISEQLRLAGVEVWRGAQAIQAGEDWGDAIQRAISQADAMILIVSRHSVQSSLIQNEVKIAIEHQIVVLPVTIDFIKTMPTILYGMNWIDYRKNQEKGISVLLEHIPPSARSTHPVEAKAEQSRGYVFISYAQEDTDFVLLLREFLRERGYSYWDYQDSERDYHSQLFLELEDVIREAAATLSVLSPAWKQSMWTPREYLFSEQVQTPVFLLRAKDMEPTLLIAGVPYIDFVENQQHGFQKLEAELQRKGLL
ncbi:MAG: hypothetical protein CUN55_10845 [Phototrophicales bacterium]|nr:MAG: hypothetical protein CUN55_10845 [Phototrophicales bacterium]